VPDVGVGGAPALIVGRCRAESQSDRLETTAVERDALVAERRRVGNRVDREVVRLLVELDPLHPRHEPVGWGARPCGRLGVEVEQSSYGVADDAA
jgi:hypothetical protein